MDAKQARERQQQIRMAKAEGLDHINHIHSLIKAALLSNKTKIEYQSSKLFSDFSTDDDSNTHVYEGSALSVVLEHFRGLGYKVSFPYPNSTMVIDWSE